MLSVLPILFRQAQQDVRIGEILVPKGTFCILHLVRPCARNCQLPAGSWCSVG